METGHLEAELLAYVEGGASAMTRGRVRRHLEVCSACREWLESYRLLVGALSGREDEEADHPASVVLARLAAGDSTDSLELALAEEHAASCGSCREAVDLAREALERARGGAAAPRWSRPVGVWRRRAIAASVAGLLAIGALALLRGDRGHEDLQMAGERMGAGSHVVQARARIEATGVSVEPGAQVVFQAGRSVAFGDGFSVASGAALSVELGGAKAKPAQTGRG